MCQAVASRGNLRIYALGDMRAGEHPQARVRPDTLKIKLVAFCGYIFWVGCFNRYAGEGHAVTNHARPDINIFFGVVIAQSKIE